jgi:hypothetical protein
MERQAAAKAQTQKAPPRINALQTKPERSSTSAQPLLELQRSVGNEAIQRLINSRYIQTKLQVSSPGDPFEQEADRVADRVMRMAEPAPVSSCSGCSGAGHVQRACTECAAEKHHHDDRPAEIIHRKATPEQSRVEVDDESSVAGALSGGGPLPEPTRAFFESRFRTDFSQVRVHTGAIAAEAARSINAKAFTLGRNIAFGSGQYAPESHEGQRLLAHELVHTIQQGASTPSFAGRGASAANQIQREPDKKITGGNLAPDSCSSTAAATGNTAGDAAKIEVTAAKSGTPCACLLVIHNNEENARKTAELMHKHCTYNLALVQSGANARCVGLPGHGAASFDPNGFFSPDIVEQCQDDPALCEKFLATKSGSKNKSEIEQFVQIQFFLGIKKCSNSFALPVIALHNNTIAETEAYRAGITAGKDVSPLKNIDITKDPAQPDPKKTAKADEPKIQPLKDLLTTIFNEDVKKKLTEKPGQTNIFRWCASGELSDCHIGNPKQPDQVIWVTNKNDFDRLSKTDVNVAWQKEPARVAKESKTDLSTLFLTMKDLMEAKLTKEITQNSKEWLDFAKKFNDTLLQLLQVKSGGTVFETVHFTALKTMLDIFYQEMVKRSTAITAAKAEKTKFSDLQFINIETPIERIKDQSDVGRQQNYDFIIGALRTLKLDCCGGQGSQAEKDIKTGLVVPPPAKEAPAKKAPAKTPAKKP